MQEENRIKGYTFKNRNTMLTRWVLLLFLMGGGGKLGQKVSDTVPRSPSPPEDSPVSEVPLLLPASPPTSFLLTHPLTEG